MDHTQQTDVLLGAAGRTEPLAADALRAETSPLSADLYRLIFEQTIDSIFITDRNARFVDVNPQACRLLGYSRAELLALPVFEVLTPTELVNQPLQLEELQRGKIVQSKRRLRSKQGTLIMVEIRSQPLSEGRLLSIARDLSEHETIDAILRENEEWLRLAHESADLGNWRLHFPTRKVYLDQRAREHYGLITDVIAVDELLNYVYPADRAQLEQQGAAILDPVNNGRQRIEHRIIHPDGNVRWLAIQARVYFDDAESTRRPMLMAGISQDITAQKRLEAQLQLHNQQLALLAEFSQLLAQSSQDYQALPAVAARRIAAAFNGGCMIRLLSPDGEWLESAALFDDNPEVMGLMQAILAAVPLQANEPSLSQQVLHSGKPLFIPVIDVAQMRATISPAFWPLLDRLDFQSGLAVSLQRRGQAIGLIYLWRIQPNRVPFQEQDLHLLQDMAERTALAISNAQLYRDLQTELAQRRQAEQALRESERRYRTLITSLPVAVYTTDAQGYLTLYNEAAAKLWGRHAELGRDRWCGAWQLHRLDGQLLPHNQSAMAMALRDDQPRDGEEMMVIQPDQSQRFIAAYPMPLHDDAGALIGGLNVLVDLTARKQAEAARQEMVENMAAAQQIAHFGSWEVNLDENLAFIEPHFWSDECCRIFGYEPGTEITTAAYRSRIHPDDFSAFHTAAREDLRAGRSGIYEYRIIRPDGAIRHIHQQKTIIIDEQRKRPLKIIGTAHDVTEHKTIEAALRTEQERLAKLAATVPGMIFIFRLGVDGIMSAPYCSPGVTALFGLDPHTLMADTTAFFNLMHPDDVAQASALMQASTVTLAPSYLEFRVRHPAKGEIWVASHSSPERAADGSWLWYGFATDITERKRIQEQMYYQANLLANVNEAIIATDQASCITSWNRGAEQLYGWVASEVIGQPLDTVVNYNYVNVLSADVKQALLTNGVWCGATTQQRKDGARRQIMATISLVKDSGGRTIGSVGVMRDVTQQQEAEIALRNSEERFNKAFRASSAAQSISRRSDGRIIDINEAFSKLTGYARHEVIGSNFQALNLLIEEHPMLEQQMLEQGIIHNHETITHDKYGEPHHILLTVERLELAGETHILNIAFDITDRKQAEARLQIALTAAHMGVWEWDMQKQQLFWSPECSTIFGITAPTAINGLLTSLLHPEDMTHVVANFERAIATQCAYTDEFRIIRGDGAVRWIANLAQATYNRQNEVLRLVGTIQDITERKNAEAERARLEEQLHQSQKMETIGRLAGGVAHDFNNLLTVIQGYSDMLLAQVGINSPLFNKLDQISRAGKRAADLTSQLLAFSRRQMLTPSIVDLNDVITNLQRMFERLIGEDILLVTVLQPMLWTVTVDSGRMEQVIMNLVVNARDAMPTGGVLTIESNNIILAQPMHDELAAPSGRVVVLTITDTGCGMDETVRAQIFEPFFTTKEQGKGTGLGLSTAYGIIKQSGGDIVVTSEPELGATFKVYLPANQEILQSSDGVEAEALSMRGSETVLLVEDEEMVRDLVQFTLEEEGYLVLTARSGSEALAAAAQHHEPIHLMVTDVVMPQMSGRELAEQFHLHYPSTKVLFTSGYTDDAIVRHGLLTAEVAFLQKPFSPYALLAKVRALLDDSA